MAPTAQPADETKVMVSDKRSRHGQVLLRLLQERLSADNDLHLTLEHVQGRAVQWFIRAHLDL